MCDGGWACIANADIVVLQKFRLVEAALYKEGAMCAMSRRFDYDPNNRSAPATANDLGIDIFCAAPEVWMNAAKSVPEKFKMGHILWDTWTLAFFMAHWPQHCYDFSRSGVILHPIHGERGDQSMSKPTDGYVDRMTWPTKFIEV